MVDLGLVVSQAQARLLLWEGRKEYVQRHNLVQINP